MTLSRILLKVSGEALSGAIGFGFDAPTLEKIAKDIVATAKLGVEIAVVVGGGNFMRGVSAAAKGMDRATADSMGMLGTVMNGLALEQAINDAGGEARTMSAMAMPSICEPFSRQVALNHLAKGRIVICAGGTGNPFFSTDTTAALRAQKKTPPPRATPISRMRKRLPKI
jgi:uridylate kinase